MNVKKSRFLHGQTHWLSRLWRASSAVLFGMTCAACSLEIIRDTGNSNAAPSAEAVIINTEGQADAVAQDAGVTNVINVFEQQQRNSLNDEARLVTVSSASFQNIDEVLSRVIPNNQATELILGHAMLDNSDINANHDALTITAWQRFAGGQNCLNSVSEPLYCAYYDASYLEPGGRPHILRFFVGPSLSFESRALGNRANPLSSYGTDTTHVALSYAFPYGIAGVIRRFELPAGSTDRANARDRIFSLGAETPVIADAIDTLNVDRKAPHNLSFTYIGASGDSQATEPTGFVSGFASINSTSEGFLYAGTQALFKIDLDLDIIKRVGEHERPSLTINSLRVLIPNRVVDSSGVVSYALGRSGTFGAVNYDINIGTPVTVTGMARNGYDFRFTFDNSNLAQATDPIKGLISARFYGPYFNAIGGSFFFTQSINTLDTATGNTTTAKFYYWGGLGLARKDGYHTP